MVIACWFTDWRIGRVVTSVVSGTGRKANLVDTDRLSSSDLHDHEKRPQRSLRGVFAKRAAYDRMDGAQGWGRGEPIGTAVAC